MTTKKHEVPQELLASLLADYKKPEDLIGENGLLKQLAKLLVEKALDAELTEHLGHERHEAVANASGNTRNGKSKKTLKGEMDGGDARICAFFACQAACGAGPGVPRRSWFGPVPSPRRPRARSGQSR
jgi:putative transposase